MLGLVQSLLTPRPNPIGVDFGSECLRLVQVQQVGNDHKIIAAASADVPPHMRRDPQARLAFFTQNVRELLAHSPFRGRDAVLSLPAATVHIRHLQLTRMDHGALNKAIAHEVRGKIPLDPSKALLRHVVAGEIYHEQQAKYEVVVMASERDSVKQFVSAAESAKLDVIAMNVEPMAIVDCFNHVYHRKSDMDLTQCFVDIGNSGTRTVIARAGQIMFARCIPIGGDHLTRAVSARLDIGIEDARTLRIKLAAVSDRRKPRLSNSSPHSTPTPALIEPSIWVKSTPVKLQSQDETAPAIAVLEVPAGEVETVDEINDDTARLRGAALTAQARHVEDACRQTVRQLVGELDSCRSYYNDVFPAAPIDRLVFIGGEARQRGMCQEIARQLGIAAQLGDPMCRMARTSDIGIESGLDRRAPQPAWVVAIGLSMGPISPNRNKRPNSPAED